MLRARDFAIPPSDLETQRKRTKRQRLLELALPCAFFAALLIAGFFSVGKPEVVRRAMVARATRLDAQPTVTMPAVAGMDAQASAPTAGLVGNVGSFHPTRRATDSAALLAKLQGADAPLAAAAAAATPTTDTPTPTTPTSAEPPKQR
mmetsp:Transcript_45371/g.125798  ORF Transcript_45371/g.125798 Transcript_45371/m.125798 type:complete len:148 (+) Transcript_45371:61-504(+)